MPAAADLAADAEDLRGVKEGLLDSGVEAFRGAKEGFRSEEVPGAPVGGTDALRGAVDGLRVVEGAGDSAGLVAEVEALLGARDGLRSEAASLGLAVGVDVPVDG